jgi:hypothetical protein
MALHLAQRNFFPDFYIFTIKTNCHQAVLFIMEAFCEIIN